MEQLQKGSKVWMTIGWIAAIAGGIIGIFIGASHAFSSFGGDKYDNETRAQGRAIFWTGILMTFVWWWIRGSAK